MSDNEFFFDNFFLPEDDPGHLLEVHTQDVSGKPVTLEFFIKRGLSLADREAAKSKSVQTRINPKNGQLEVVGVDEGAFQVEMLARSIVSWPFKHRDGKPVEVSRQNIRNMDARLADILVKEVMGLMERQEKALDFFESKSDDLS